MKEALTIRQTELNNWVKSKLDVEEYAWLLESAESVGNFCCFLEDLIDKISKGYKPTVKELGVCHNLGLIRLTQKDHKL